MSSQEHLPVEQPNVAELINIDDHQRAHRPNGDFMKNEERALVEAYAEQIQAGLGGFDTVEQKVQNDEQNAQKQADKQTALESLSGLMESGSVLDGPTLTKAGLDYPTRLKLGYGDLESMKSDARALADEKRAAQEVQQAQEARIAEASETKARGAEQAAVWQQEVDAARAKRVSTDARIGELVDGTAAVKGMTYKEKLENGGERGVKAIIERAKMTSDAAVEVAASEGHDVSHLRPRYQEVVTKPAAEQRAREMATLLDGFKYRATAEQPNEKASELEDNLPKRLSEMMDIKERERIQANMNQATAEHLAEQKPGVIQRGLERLKALQEERVKAMVGFMYEGEVDGGTVVSADGSVTRTRESMKRVFAKAGSLVKKIKQEAVLAATGAGFTGGDDEASRESQKRRTRLAVAAVAAGGVVVAALAMKYGSSDAIHEALPKSPKGHGGIGDALQHLAQPGGGHGEASKHIHETISLRSGENPWTAAQHALGAHASVEQVDQVKDAILQNNHITEAQAHNLAVGTQLHMPVELIEKLRSESAS